MAGRLNEDGPAGSPPLRRRAERPLNSRDSQPPGLQIRAQTAVAFSSARHLRLGVSETAAPPCLTRAYVYLGLEGRT